MERLTNENHKEFGFCVYTGKKNPYSAPIIIGELSAPPNADYSPNEILVDVFERLAAYEDTGLEPKEAQLIANVLREVGETYNCWFDYVVNCVLESSHLKDLAQAEKAGRLVVLPCKVGDKVYRVITTASAAPIITEIEIKTLGQAVDLIGWIGEKQLLVSWYLTREEAEAALKKREADHG